MSKKNGATNLLPLLMKAVKQVYEQKLSVARTQASSETKTKQRQAQKVKLYKPVINISN